MSDLPLVIVITCAVSLMITLLIDYRLRRTWAYGAWHSTSFLADPTPTAVSLYVAAQPAAEIPRHIPQEPEREISAELPLTPSGSVEMSVISALSTVDGDRRTTAAGMPPSECTLGRADSRCYTIQVDNDERLPQGARVINL